MFKATLVRLALIGTAALALSAATAIAQTQPKELKFANFITTNSITYRAVLKQWIDDVNAKLGEKYQIRGYWGGTMGRDPSQYSKLVRDGVADIAFVTFGESSSVFPDTQLFELPFQTNSSTEASLAHWRLNKKIGLKGYDEFHWLGLFGLPPYQFHLTKPAADLASLANRKVRGGGRIHTQIVEALGMTPVSGPVTSSAESLNRGTWDGVFIEWSAGNVFGVHKVAKHHYDMPLSTQALGIAMNKKVYESMDAQSRKAIDDLSGELLVRLMGTTWDQDAKEVVHEIAADKEAVTVKPTAADMEKARKAVDPIIQEWVRASPHNTQVYEAFNQTLKEIRAQK